MPPVDTQRIGEASEPATEKHLHAENPAVEADTTRVSPCAPESANAHEVSDTAPTRVSRSQGDPGRLKRWLSSLERRFACGQLHSSTPSSWVFRGKDLESDKSVAVKLLKDPQPAARNSFIAEALLLSELEHPGIVRYIAHGELCEGGAYIVTEWLPGEDLGATLRKGPLAPADAITLVTRAAHALAAAHARGIVHLDIKPSNLFLVRGDFEDIRLLDFGIARLTRSVTSDPEEDAMAGTPGYMAPEQVLGQDVSPATDVFALGCVLFTCITGRRIFGGDTFEVMSRTVEEPIPPLGYVVPGVHPALEALVASLLSLSPAVRPADANALLAVLAALPVECLEEVAPSAKILLQPSGLSGTERVPTTVVLVRHATEDREDSTVADRGGHSSFFETLAGGMWLAIPRGKATSLDQAMHAARLALDVRARWPRAAMAIVAGRAVDRATTPQLHELLAEAESLVRRAHPGEILLDAASASLVQSEFAMEPLDCATTRLVEPRAASAAEQATGRDRLCLGRDSELGSLLSIAKDAFGTPGARAVLLTGPAGIGKSNVLLELVGRLETAGFRPARWSAYGDPLSAGSALRLVSSLLEAAPREEPSLSRLLARENSSSELDAARPAGSVDDVHRAFAKLVSAELERGPLLLQLEDIHWADLGSLRAVDFVLAALAHRPLLVIATARPEVRELYPNLWQRRSLQEVRINPLDDDDAHRLVTLRLGTRISSAARARLMQRAHGNPFLLHELISAQAEGRGDEMSETELGIAQSRLRVLAPDARRILRAASILGDPFTPQAVAFLLGDAAALGYVERWLDWLTAREVVRRREESGSVKPALVFAHALLRDAAYDMLTDGDRKLGHRLAASLLEAAERPNAVVTAQHYARAGDAAGAGRWYFRATLEAFKIGDFGAAISSAEQALGQELSQHERGHVQAIGSHAYRMMGDVENAKRLSGEALRALPANSPLWRQAARTAMMAGASAGTHRHG